MAATMIYGYKKNRKKKKVTHSFSP